MARTKTSAPAEQKTKQIVLTKEQYDKLTDISTDINRAKNTLSDIGDDTDMNERQIGYIAGKVFIVLDRLEDVLDEIIDQIDPHNEEEEDNNLF
jgi:CRISPR/Cas system CSM-associated protein Csm2 small subunit